LPWAPESWWPPWLVETDSSLYTLKVIWKPMLASYEEVGKGSSRQPVACMPRLPSNTTQAEEHSSLRFALWTKAAGQECSKNNRGQLWGGQNTGMCVPSSGRKGLRWASASTQSSSFLMDLKPLGHPQKTPLLPGGSTAHGLIPNISSHHGLQMGASISSTRLQISETGIQSKSFLETPKCLELYPVLEGFTNRWGHKHVVCGVASQWGGEVQWGDCPLQQHNLQREWGFHGFLGTGFPHIIWGGHYSRGAREEFIWIKAYENSWNTVCRCAVKQKWQIWGTKTPFQHVLVQPAFQTTEPIHGLLVSPR
jgi:hypothetical protein